MEKTQLLQEATSVADYWNNNYKTLLGKSATDSEKRAIVENMDFRVTKLEIAILAKGGRDEM